MPAVKYIHLLIAGFRRNTIRSLLIFAQVVFVFILYGSLQGLIASMDLAIRHTHADRMFVASRLGRGDLLPVSIAGDLRRTPGVARVTFESQLPCTYRRPDQYVWALGIDPETYFTVYAENRTAPDQLRALVALRTGAIVGELLASRLGWKVGDHVTLQCFTPRRDGTRDWGFDVVGLFRQVERPEFSDLVLLNYSYRNEARAADHDAVNIYGLQISRPSESIQIGHIIDARFLNSPHPTSTSSEADAARAGFRSIGDVALVSRTVTLAALISLLVASGALMMQSVRERRADIATLKAIGFTHGRVLALVLTESVGIWVAGALAGLGIAQLLLPRAQDIVNNGHVPSIVVAFGVVLAVGGGLLSGALPAWRTLRIHVAAARQ